MALNEAGNVRVTWSRPTLGPGQVITGYSVQYRRRGSTSYTTRSVSGSSTTSYTITNLNLGAVYEVRVASIGLLGLGGHCCGSGKQVTIYNCECMHRVYKLACLYFGCVIFNNHCLLYRMWCVILYMTERIYECMQAHMSIPIMLTHSLCYKLHYG